MDTVTYDLKWGQELASRINKQIITEIGRIRAEPPLIPVVLTPSRYEDVVQSYQITAPPPVIAGGITTLFPKGISSKNTKILPIKISSQFVVAQQQFSDESLAARLAVRCASDLAFAEDDIILNGKYANLGASNVKDESDTLTDQEGLFEAALTAAAAAAAQTTYPERPHQRLGPGASVVTSIFDGSCGTSKKKPSRALLRGCLSGPASRCTYANSTQRYSPY